MKTIMTATGNKKLDIDNLQESALYISIKDILTDHRNALISRLLTDLPSYISYQFHSRVSGDQVRDIADRLISMKNSPIDLSKYNQFVQLILTEKNIHLTSEPFYREINESLSYYLRPNQGVLAQ